MQYLCLVLFRKIVGDLSHCDKSPTIFLIVVQKIVDDLSLNDKSPTIFLAYNSYNKCLVMLTWQVGGSRPKWQMQYLCLMLFKKIVGDLSHCDKSPTIFLNKKRHRY